MGNHFWFALVIVSLAILAVRHIAEKLAEIARVLNRIESRLTLLNPLEEERNFLEHPLDAKARIVKRAMPPDTWSNRWLELQEIGLYKQNPKHFWKDRTADNKEYRGE